MVATPLHGWVNGDAATLIPTLASGSVDVGFIALGFVLRVDHPATPDHDTPLDPARHVAGDPLPRTVDLSAGTYILETTFGAEDLMARTGENALEAGQRPYGAG